MRQLRCAITLPARDLALFWQKMNVGNLMSYLPVSLTNYSYKRYPSAQPQIIWLSSEEEHATSRMRVLLIKKEIAVQ